MAAEGVITIGGRDGLTARLSERGAELTGLELGGREYLWQADPRWWGRHAPVLFPVVGALRPGTVSDRGPCPMGRHGIARDLRHRLVGRDGGSATFELVADEGTLALYPYRFALRTTYAVAGATLRLTFEVANEDDVPMPYALGGHPAFNVPLCPGERFEDYELRFSRGWRASSPSMAQGGLWDFSRRVPVLDGADRLPLSHRLFDVDTLLLEGVPDSTVTLAGPAGHGVRVDFAGFPYLGLWSAAGDAPFVAVEPWHGCATALDEDGRLEHKRQVRTLGPGASESLSFCVTAF